jgi:hypothetical protein
MPSKHDPAKDHSHYGESVQIALLAFQNAWSSYEAMTWLQMRENPARIDSIQTAWNILVRARRSETGTGFFLNREQYEALQR